ncbi:DUF5686 and carboxypeptidase-like regulatory domain-containing protein [Spirosoma rhododendri]|uniref:Carboxypeptidase-like regulatory domain-containing protein n=1 Tax=Spirosoma rhododendri TaxID=2728024 RepID=A0A7L5DFZ7_9BACT|nr:DUF5686 and carboxypeptidase-like regulatory domain-containing protein [Spirosoma rhododendri]QJD77116.1 carboxypeptidase-like regulatory domain-containing protein [Spirosoma rhododendri]
MEKRLRTLTFFLLAGLLLCLSGQLYAQTTYSVTGLVTDAKTGEPVPFASVALVGKRVGTITDEKGRYTLRTNVLSDSLVVSSMGYANTRRAIDGERLTQAIDVQLPMSAGNALQEVVVRAGENPAFRVLRQVRKNRSLNDRSRLKAYEYDSYQKTEMALSHLTDRMRQTGLFRKINQAMSQVDSIVDSEGNRLLPLLVSESVTHTYYRTGPQRRREDVRKTRIRGVAVDDAGVSSQLLGGTSLASQNFYDNYIPILGKDFASPIGDNWRNWYEFFLADTTQIGDHICYEIQFDPKRPEDLAFTGKAWIDTSSFALCEIEARIGSRANLNYVRALTIEQELEPTPDSTGAKTKEGWLPVGLKLTADLTGVGKQSLGIRAQVTLRNSNVVVNQPKPVLFYEQPIEPSDTVATTNEAYWRTVQRTLAGPDSLNKADQKSRMMIETLRSVPAVRTAEAVGQIAVTGFLKVGSFDLGPYPYLFAVNTVEGLRTRVGFRTNEDFSRHLVLRGYLAYGTLDKEFKYGVEADYLISRQHWTQIGVRMSYDLERLGLTPELIGGNRIFYALSRFGRYRGAYQSKQKEAFFVTEPVKGIMLRAMVGSRTFDPLFPYAYRSSPDMGDQSPLRSDINDAYWAIEARLARKEKYIMDGNERITLGTKRAPVLTVRYTRGTTGLGSDFNYSRITLRAQQTLRLGPLGRMTYLLSAGFTPSTLPAPLLFPHIGNPTPLLTVNTFNRMQFYEFVSDRFVAVHMQHRFEGFLFNRLPGIRKLNWRLVANADMLWGSLSQANQDLESNKMLPNGQRPIHFGHLDPSVPYVELGYGIDNIFKIFRVQAVHRLTYLEPGPNNIPTNRFAIKAAASISF